MGNGLKHPINEKKWYTPFCQSAQISKLLNFLQLLKRILRAFLFQGGTIRGVVGYTTLLLSPSNIRLSRLAYLCCHTHFAYKTTLNYCYTYYKVKKTAWSKFLEVGVGIKTIQVVSQALVAEDVLLLRRK